MGDETTEFWLFQERVDEDEETPMEQFFTNLSVVIFMLICSAPVISLIVFFIYGHHLFPDLIP
jgi:hypothetical protein